MICAEVTQDETSREGLCLTYRSRQISQSPDSAIDLQLAFYVGVLVFGFLFGLRPLESQVNLLFLSIPAYLTILIWGSTMVLAGIAAKFRKSRLPILTVVFILVFAIQYFVEPKAVFRTVVLKNESKFARLVQDHQRYSFEMRKTVDGVIDQNALKGSLLLKNVESIDRTAWEAIKSRMSKSNLSGNRKTLVVVTCPGGGIHAAAWSAYVLEQLEKRYATTTTSSVAPAVEPDETDGPKTKTSSKEFEKLKKVVQRSARIESIKQSSKISKTDEQGTNPKPGTSDAIPQAFAGERIDSHVDYPVVEVQMPFLLDDMDLPLNWKLSEKQKLAYPKAWQKLRNGTTLPGNKHHSFFSELDEIFGLPKGEVKPAIDGE